MFWTSHSILLLDVVSNLFSTSANREGSQLPITCLPLTCPFPRGFAMPAEPWERQTGTPGAGLMRCVVLYPSGTVSSLGDGTQAPLYASIYLSMSSRGTQNCQKERDDKSNHESMNG